MKTQMVSKEVLLAGCNEKVKELEARNKELERTLRKIRKAVKGKKPLGYTAEFIAIESMAKKALKQNDTEKL